MCDHHLLYLLFHNFVKFSTEIFCLHGGRLQRDAVDNDDLPLLGIDFDQDLDYSTKETIDDILLRLRSLVNTYIPFDNKYNNA